MLFRSERCELALAGPTHPDDDAVSFLLGVGQLVRMGEKPEAWLPDVAAATERVARGATNDWATSHAFIAADIVFRAAGDRRASRDLDAIRRRVGAVSVPLPSEAPTDPARFLCWIESQVATPSAAGADLLPAGFPPSWLGANFEVYGVPTGGAGTVSFAVRWHGDRPAVLWEQTGDATTLSSSVLAPDWSSAEIKGETLWPAPTGVGGTLTLMDDGGSFS